MYEIVMAAVLQNGRCLGAASEELRDNRDIVMAAVSQNGRSLGQASDVLRADKEVVIAAVSQAQCTSVWSPKSNYLFRRHSPGP